VTFSTTSTPSKPETAMHFFSSSQFPCGNSKLPQVAAPMRAAGSVVGPKIDCGWYDSSFDLARGLEICEDVHNDMLYQLWELSQH
jgi:hypothetical protein